MKKRFLLLFAGSTAFVMVACNNEETTTTTTDTTTATVTAPDTATTSTITSGPLSAEDSAFVMEAAQAGLMEVEAGNIAQQNASTERVKNFAAMMVRDHSQANTELRSLVSGRLTLPDSVDSKTRQHLESMKKMKGAAFDRHYMSIMVNDHKEDVEKFEKAANTLQDPALKNWVQKTLPVLKTHSDSAQAISKKS